MYVNILKHFKLAFKQKRWINPTRKKSMPKIRPISALLKPIKPISGADILLYSNLFWQLQENIYVNNFYLAKWIRFWNIFYFIYFFQFEPKTKRKQIFARFLPNYKKKSIWYKPKVSRNWLNLIEFRFYSFGSTFKNVWAKRRKSKT